MLFKIRGDARITFIKSFLEDVCVKTLSASFSRSSGASFLSAALSSSGGVEGQQLQRRFVLSLER